MMTLPVRKRLVGLVLPLLIAVVALAGPLGTPSAVAQDSSEAMATEQVYVRTGPSTDYPIIGNLEGGDYIWLTGYSENGFYELWYGDYVGYAHSDYISTSGYAAEAAASAPEPEPAPAPSNGQLIADYALQFQGYPYIWAGNTPSGFDCSGFTQYVVQNTLGYDISHSTDVQATMGAPVAWGEWQVGDLVFFSGTGASGYYSHVGIYIGGGNMIHAENPGTGVVISSLYSDYYSSHYAYAVRLG